MGSVLTEKFKGTSLTEVFKRVCTCSNENGVGVVSVMALVLMAFDLRRSSVFALMLALFPKRSTSCTRSS